MVDFLHFLKNTSYPGRGILVGKDRVYYFIMGRSENSRNRVFVKTEDGIRTEAYDPAKLSDPSLIIYHPVRTMGRDLVVTNGDQTDTICEHGDFRRGLMTREYEPDEPNWTPRISAIMHEDGSFELSILKRKDGRWEGRYIRGHSPSGRAEYGYVYGSSYRECRAKRQQRLESLQELPAKTSSLTLNQAAERFLADKQDKLKQSTLARYAYMLEHYILPALGAVLVCQLTANQISDFLRRLQKNGLSGKSARDVGVLLKSILKYSAPKAGCSCPGLTVESVSYTHLTLPTIA